MKNLEGLEDVSDEQLQESFRRVAGPLLERLSDLETSQQQKCFEIMVLRNAYENMIKELDEYKEKMKKLPRSLLNSEVL